MKSDANMVGARSFVVCNAVILCSSVPKTLCTCCRGSEGGSVDGDHRIQLWFAIGTFSDFGRVHFEITSRIAGEVLFPILLVMFVCCWCRSQIVRLAPPADTCSEVVVELRCWREE